MTLWDMIMGDYSGTAKFTKADWARLGKQEVKNEETIKAMLMEGYGAVANED